MALLGLAACAGNPMPPPPSSPPVAAVPVTYGTIVSRRPTGIPMGDVQGGEVRSTILYALGGASADPLVEGGAYEFIVREDDGVTISVVQADAGGLRPGERVVVSSGAHTRLSRAAH
jgi:outer membrane lipoprotein SlyB